MSPRFLSGEKVRLRAVEPDDVLMLMQAENDSDCWLYDATVAPLSVSLLSRYARSYRADPEHDGELRLVVEIVDGNAVGVADLYEISMRHQTAMVGIYVLSDFRKRGLAKDALSILGRYAASALGLHSLGARIPTVNAGSVALFESLGYERCGVIREWLHWDGCRYDMALFQKIF